MSEPILVYTVLNPLSDPHLRFESDTEASWCIKLLLQEESQVSTCELPVCQPVWRNYESVMPQGAFYGGFENGSPVAVGRGTIRGALTPGKVINGQLSVEWGGSENFLDTFDILCDCDGKFVTFKHGDPLPEHSLIAGSEHGHPMYVARIHHEGDLLLGKYYPNYNSAYIPYQGNTITITDQEFEIFVCNCLQNEEGPLDQYEIYRHYNHGAW